MVALENRNIPRNINKEITSVSFINIADAPDVNVVQFLNGSLYCNAAGIPMNYTFLKWEHQSFNGQHLRYLKMESAILTIDVTDDNPVYELDGRYWCSVTNGVPDVNGISIQKGNLDVKWPGKIFLFLFKTYTNFMSTDFSFYSNDTFMNLI